MPGNRLGPPWHRRGRWLQAPRHPLSTVVDAATERASGTESVSGAAPLIAQLSLSGLLQVDPRWHAGGDARRRALLHRPAAAGRGAPRVRSAGWFARVTPGSHGSLPSQ